MTELVKRDSVIEIEANYKEAIKSVTEIFESAKKVVSSLKKIMKYLPENVFPKSEYCVERDGLNNSLKAITAQTWKEIMTKTQMTEAMTEKRRRAIDEQINSGNMPEITVENIMSVLESLFLKTDELLDESIKEAFEFLRPRRSEYKTNSEFEIGKKVILNGFIEFRFGGFSLDCWRSDRLHIIDNAFSLLDGKGVSKYPNDLETKIRESMRDRKASCETDYFSCDWYKKGSLHIEFKRLDLLEKLNKIGGGNRIKTGEGK